MKSSITLILIIIININFTYGFLTYFNLQKCPEGWSEYTPAQGRVIVSVTDQADAGITVGDALKDREDRQHYHEYASAIELPEKDIAAIHCCNNQAAANGAYKLYGNVSENTSNLPFSQLLLCQKTNFSDLVVPFGTIGYFNPEQNGCPTNWAPFQNVEGRVLTPAYKTGGMVASLSPPFKSGEVRTHHHSYNISVQTNDASFIGAEGCCNKDPAKLGTFFATGDSSDETIDIPYIQLLTCISNEPTFNVSLPSGGLLFNSVGCEGKKLKISFDFAGRLPVALPKNALAGASFGGNSFEPSGDSNPTHHHYINGSVTFPSTGVGLGSGCCGKGYTKAGVYEYHTTSVDEASDFPYILSPLCEVI